MSTEREEMLRTYPESRQLFGQFGQDYDYEFDKRERVAIDDYIEYRGSQTPQALGELETLLARFPDNDSMRDALLHLGVKWTMWDQNDDWIPFVQRVRGWLEDSLADPDGQQP